MTQAWLKHNIEEVGVLEHILPDAYADRADEAGMHSPPASTDQDRFLPGNTGLSHTSLTSPNSR